MRQAGGLPLLFLNGHSCKMDWNGKSLSMRGLSAVCQPRNKPFMGELINGGKNSLQRGWALTPDCRTPCSFCIVRKLGCVLAALEWWVLLVELSLVVGQGQMITKAVPGGEKVKETCCNNVFKTFCSGQLCWKLTYEVSWADVYGSWYIPYKCRSNIRLLGTCYSCTENLPAQFFTY